MLNLKVPGRVIPRTQYIVVMAAPLGAQGCEVCIKLTGWCQDKWTSCTGNLPEKHRDITDFFLKMALSTNKTLTALK